MESSYTKQQTLVLFSPGDIRVYTQRRANTIKLCIINSLDPWSKILSPCGMLTWAMASQKKMNINIYFVNSLVYADITLTYGCTLNFIHAEGCSLQNNVVPDDSMLH